MTENRQAILVLAAGVSQRFKAGNKLLSEFCGRPLLAWVLERICELDWFQKVLVIGKEDYQYLSQLGHSFGFDCICNEAYLEGMGRSIATGIRNLRPGCQGVAIQPADMPFIQAETYRKLLAGTVSCSGRDCIAVLNVEGRRGHPVWFGESFFQDLIKLNADCGARSILKENVEKLCVIASNDFGTLIDLDTDVMFQYYERLFTEATIAGQVANFNEILRARFVPDAPFLQS